MDRIAALRAFAAVAGTHSFSQAAQQLKQSKSAVSKHVTALEHGLGVRLLNRTTRRVSLTAAGEDYRRRAESILAALDDADNAARRQAATPSGRLRIAAPMTFGILHLGGYLADFAARYPAINLDVSLSDRYVDLIEERFDVAVRIGKLKDSSLQARALAPSRVIMCAAPKYLKAHGTPKSPGELVRHRCLTYTYADGSSTWRLKGGTVNVTGPCHANNGDLLRQLALKGLGLVLLPSFIVGPDVRSGKLVSIMAPQIVQDQSINAVYPPSRYVAAPVRAFVDFMAAQCAPKPSWD
jgi:DNA-binding transcriptional LysR family regulator